VVQTHGYLNANRDELVKCEEHYVADDDDLVMARRRETVKLEMALERRIRNVYPDLNRATARSEKSYCFEQARCNEVDVDEFEVYVSVFPLGSSLERWALTREVLRSER
jgi:hypothetical protein